MTVQKFFVNDINAIVDAVRSGGDDLPEPAAKPGIGARTGVGAPKRGGGIASPLSETTAPNATGEFWADREYYPARDMQTTDGEFVIKYAAIKTLKFQDANGEAVEFHFAEPDPDKALGTTA
ncbi:hypothetical protein [Methylococcus mesophilus]|uniref:hypothetical protein n=1 Tax=Methylococcus mesophilus TaxID=2993564 RepID=UPI00224B2945|nr:hypothetical protein [Methylococcus mesophilus]UZR28072.1 hypothetical protein OOT43_15340 [Methylococcus mesophilus]